jgi:DHA1 family bicyclomycin/chloramphenicol resistance-like MFS transporter
MALAPIPYGALSDRWGRRPVLWLSGSIYVIGAVASSLAPTLPLLLAGRFVWGLGAAGGRVVAFAILRDTHEGEKMARLMSYMMAVFILVPILAPSLGALLVAVGPWRGVFVAGAVAGVAVLAWSLRLEETLAPENRRTDLFANVPATARQMATTLGIAAPVLALTAVQAVMSTYLASSQLMIGEILDRNDQFPIIFGATAAVLGVASLVNGRLLGRTTIPRILRPVGVVYLAAALVTLGATLAAGGRPGFWVFMPLVAATLACQMFLMSNLNTLALAPMAHAAGTASALTATFSTACGATIGALVDARFDDTLTPFAVALGVSALTVGTMLALTLGRAGAPAAAATT